MEFHTELAARSSFGVKRDPPGARPVPSSCVSALPAVDRPMTPTPLHAFCADVRAFLRAHATRLAQLVGQRFEAGWLAWDTLRDCWAPTDPIVLAFQGRQLAVCQARLSELAMAYDSVDVLRMSTASRVRYLRNAQPAFAAAASQVLRAVHVVEYHAHFFPVDTASASASGWVLSGLAFDFVGGAHLRVFDALDEAPISAQPVTGPDYRATRIASL